ncbi:MAG: hypothetical protein WC628_00800 [Candidatus Omnitrophota bacterium]
MLRPLRKKAQSTAEYVIVLGLIVAAVMAMQTYIKRGFQGRVKDAVDYKEGNITGPIGGVGASATPLSFETTQYEPYYLSSSFNSERTSNETEDWEAANKGALKKTLDEASKRTGNQTIANTSNED